MSHSRQTEYDIHEVFTNRWSPRAFTGEPISEDILMRFFEAARWTPSARNSQPWRFIYALNDGSAEWEIIQAPIEPKNKAWAQNASALVLFVSQTRWIPLDSDQEVPLPYNEFDVGAAAMNFALQATLCGWVTHAIGGFDKKAMRQKMHIPELFNPLLLMAVSRRNPDASGLCPELQAREKPNGRYALNDLVFKGNFKV